MTRPVRPSIGFVPSLEVIPFFEPGFHSECPLHLVPHASYGRIARDMLTGQLTGAIIPWEIFAIDVLALPGERTHWRMDLFLHPCPTELVLTDSIRRGLNPAKPRTPGKLPGRLTIGVESRNSLTRRQLQHWIACLGHQFETAISFRMLPMDLMIQGLRAEVLDGFVAPSPWGMAAEELGIGKIDPNFSPGSFAQKLVVVRRRDSDGPDGPAAWVGQLSDSRERLRNRGVFSLAAERMKHAGKPAISSSLLEQAARRYSHLPPAEDSIPDLTRLVQELRDLESCAALPAQVAPNEQTARLLLT